MKLKDVLRKVTTETFVIDDYELIEGDPVAYHINNPNPTDGLLGLLNATNYFTNDDMHHIFWKTVNNVVDQTYNAIASDDIISYVYLKGGDVDSIRCLVSNVCATVVGEERVSSYDNSDISIIESAINDIIVINVEMPNDFNFENMIKLIKTGLESNNMIKIILVGNNESITTRIVPVLNKYARYIVRMI